MTVIGIAGSLRRRSLNRALLRAAVELAPEGMRIEVFDLVAIPLYNADLDESLDGGPYPEAVADLRARVESAGAVLMTVPEYNWGPTGVLKNAVDWLSRPAGASPLANKPMALAGASPGPAGTGRAQLQLRQNLLSTNSYVLQKPLVQIGGGTARFDDDLRLVDAATRDLVRSQLVALMDWAARVGGPAPADAAIRLG
jgi:chromate reductase, NAD(P)H dehydrogenase (quinone)